MDVFINAIATGRPAHEVHHRFGAFARRLIDPRRLPLVDRMVARSGIERRWSVMRPNERAGGDILDEAGHFAFGRFPSTAERMKIYDREAGPFAAATVAGLDPDKVARATHLIVTSCTGFAAPGVDLQLVRALGLPTTTQRTVVGFMGCYAAINALRLARSIVAAEPDAVVLVVAIELCTIHMQETGDLETLLSFMIFGDGCAAALVSADPEGLRLDGFRTAMVPAADHLITWHIGDDGFDMRLSGEVPAALADAVPVAVDEIEPDGAGAVDLWAVHPGGRSVLDAVERALALPAAALAASRKVLSDYGNMSSPSVLYVLAAMLAAAPPVGARGLALAFGPGLTAEGMRFTVAR